MNICLISQEYPPDTNWGGIATYTQVLALQLAQMGQKVHVVALAEGEEYTAHELGVTVHRICRTPLSPFAPMHLDGLGGLNHGVLYFSQRVYEKVLEIHEKDPIDVIEAPETCAQALLTFQRLQGVIKVTRLHTPFFWVRHLNNMPETAEHLVRDQLEKLQTELSTCVTAPTLAMAEVVRNQWGTHGIDVIPNFFNLKSYTPDLSVYRQHLEGLDYLLFFGRLEYRKGAQVLVQALPAVLIRHPEISVVFVGSDSIYNAMSMKEYLRLQLAGYEDKITFIDNIAHASLYPIIERARLVVLPSLWENFPYVCLEAMSLGKAIVASNSGGFPEIVVDHKEGMLFPPGDAKSLEKVLLAALGSTDLTAMGEKARMKSAVFDTEKVVGKMLDYYRKAANKTVSRSAQTMGLKVAYVLRHIPVPSETFVINEIIALQSLGTQVHPISLLPAQQCHEQLMVQLGNKVVDLSAGETIAVGERSRHFPAVTRIAERFGLSPVLTRQAALVADYLLAQGIEHVHAHFATESAFVALVAAKAAGITCTFTAHAYDIFRSEDTGTIREDSPEKRLRILLEECDGGFTVSEFNRKYILSRTGQEFAKKIGILRCGIAPEKFDSLSRVGRDSVTILCVGRFVEKKGYEYLLRAFANLKAVNGKVRLRLVGDGDLKQPMQSLAEELGVSDSVDFLGSVSSEVVHAEMQRADLFALHSVTAANGDMEGIPVSLMEAAAAGLPVVSTLHSGIPELVLDGNTGFLVPERDVAEFSRKLIALASSAETRERMGRAAREFVTKNFNQQREAEKLAGIFMNTIQERKEMATVTDRSCMVDIIMPTFNPDKSLISRAIRSIIDQELQSWRLYVVKDGGDVDLADVIAAFDDPRIELSEIPHAGKPVALNHAIAQGNAKYIAYLDDDDIWYPNHLKTAIDHMEEYGVDFVYTNAHEVNVERENLQEVSRKSLGQGTLTELTLVSISHINAVHTRSVIEQAGPYDVERSFFIDWDMFLRMGVISRPVHLDTYTCEHYIYIGADKQHTNTITGIHKNDPERSVKMLQEMYERSLALATPEIFVDFIYDYRSKAWHVENKQKDLDALYEQIGIRDVKIITMTQEFKKKLKELCPEAAGEGEDGLDAAAPASDRKPIMLFVDYEVPRYDMFAGSRTNFMYLAMLVKMGIEVKFLPADFQRIEPYSTELNHLGIETLDGDWYRDNWQWWLERNGGDIDYVFFHKPDPATKFLDAVKLHTNAAIIYQCHDLHYLRLQRKSEVEKDQAIRDEANLYEKREDHIFLNSNVILTFSDVEEGLIKAKFPQKKVETVPLFFYQSVPETNRDFAARKDLLYVGGFDHTPNRDAVAWFCSEVFPAIKRQIPDIVLNIVGNRPPKDIANLASKNIRILGKVSDAELNALYDEVKLVVVPLRFGAGVKGKLIEAMYHGVPVVATSIGVEGVKGIEQLITPQDDPTDFAAQVVSLYRDENKLKDLSLQGTAFIEENLTTQKTAQLMGDILSSCKKTTASGTAAPLVVRAATQDAVNEEVPRLIAFYLPQYHPIPENDKWWGKGFTEWRNVSKAKPLFPGHYQPHIPSDLGFYDLRLEETRIAQAEMARQYGINGFCYYHYWFNGKRLLERPLEDLLKSGKPDFPFCICWATENWTRRWDGEDQHVLMEQNYGEEDDRTHIRTLFPIFEDPRYIRVNGKPMFLIYRTENMPDPGRTAEIWREEARMAGIGELYLVRVESIGACDPASINFDAALEFAPDWNNRGPRITADAAANGSPVTINNLKEVYEKNYVHRYDDLVTLMENKPTPDYTWFRCVTPSWDNSARRQEGAIIFTDSTPGKYRAWLESAINHTKKNRSGEEKLVFVNAWNEWAEGNHLEPDHMHGRGYLEATRSALDNTQEKPLQQLTAAQANALQDVIRQVAEKEWQVRELSSSLRELENQLREKELLVAVNAIELKLREERIQDLLNSASWKVTEPLRKVFEFLSAFSKK
jgi:glycosyltransferase involved in cell wall biosynthesis